MISPNSGIVCTCLAITLAWSCRTAPKEVVVYCSIGRKYAGPVLDEFTRRSGIKVRPAFGTDGVSIPELVDRLNAGKDRSGTDVFWNAEFIQTLELKRRGVLERYSSPQAAGIPVPYTDPERYWIGLGARCRVLIVHTRLTPSNLPRALDVLQDPEIPSRRVGIAYPVAGTAAVHAAALSISLGPDATRWFYQRLQNRGVRVLDAASAVQEQVARWQLAIGLADSNDGCAALAGGVPVRVELPDQDSIGTLLIPGTIAMLKGSPHPVEARKLIDYLVSRETDSRLIDSGFSQISLREPEILRGCLEGRHLKAMNATPEAIFERLPSTRAEMEQIFVR